MSKCVHTRTLLILTVLSASCGDDGYPADDESSDESNVNAPDASVQSRSSDASNGWGAGNNDAGATPRDTRVDAGAGGASSWDASQTADSGSNGSGGNTDAGYADAGGRVDAGGSVDAGGNADAGGNFDAGASCNGLTYDSFGRQFLSDYCVSCHGAVGPKAGVRLDSLAGLMAKKAGAKSAVLSSDMPQGNKKPSSAERERFGQWIDCGPK